MRISSLCAAALLFGCGDHDHPPTPAEETTFQPLIEVEDLAPIGREVDPFVSEQPPLEEPPLECETSGVLLEEEQHWLELDTAECDFITVAAGARFAVEEGQELSLSVSHFDLKAAEPATAELRLRFEECDVWQKSIAIPSAANVLTERFAAPCGIAQGGQVFFHLHNHGQNTYQLRSLEVLR
ncbi:MAG: hypothetical protein EOO73_13920 [Myxococcales bacterium]|nr:MAG: hypothetical protein EOO73_13920 [Myxococcales bacterium]